MNDGNIHIPVLLEETIEMLALQDGGKYLDGTLGLGGHSSALLERSINTQICALDRDNAALLLARENLSKYDGRIHFFHKKYSQFAIALQELKWEKLDGALLDIGVSSMQLDFADRGFSFRENGPLDMRMDRDDDHISAWNFINKENFENIKRCLTTFGEEPLAGRIAKNIIEARQKKTIETTLELANIIENSYPISWRRKARNHPATRSFQAIRMLINDELGELKSFLDNILRFLSIGARLAIITFHSLEDRLVKQTIKYWAEGCRCPKYQPICTCKHISEVKILTKKPITATDLELNSNPRSKSAKLRVIEKISEGVANASF